MQALLNVIGNEAPSPAKKSPKNAESISTQLFRRIDLTAKEMSAKHKETSEGGLAVSVVLC